MTTQSDTPGEGLDPKALEAICRALATHGGFRDRDLERVAGEIVDALRSEGFSVASDTAALPSGYEGLVDTAKMALMYLETGFLDCAQCGHENATATLDAAYTLREAIAATIGHAGLVEAAYKEGWHTANDSAPWGSSSADHFCQKSWEDSEAIAALASAKRFKTGE